MEKKGKKEGEEGQKEEEGEGQLEEEGQKEGPKDSSFLLIFLNIIENKYDLDLEQILLISYNLIYLTTDGIPFVFDINQYRHPLCTMKVLAINKQLFDNHNFKKYLNQFNKAIDVSVIHHQMNNNMSSNSALNFNFIDLHVYLHLIINLYQQIKSDYIEYVHLHFNKHLKEKNDKIMSYDHYLKFMTTIDKYMTSYDMNYLYSLLIQNNLQKNGIIWKNIKDICLKTNNFNFFLNFFGSKIIIRLIINK